MWNYGGILVLFGLLAVANAKGNRTNRQIDLFGEPPVSSHYVKEKTEVASGMMSAGGNRYVYQTMTSSGVGPHMVPSSQLQSASNGYYKTSSHPYQTSFDLPGDSLGYYPSQSGSVADEAYQGIRYVDNNGIPAGYLPHVFDENQPPPSNLASSQFQSNRPPPNNYGPPPQGFPPGIRPPSSGYFPGKPPPEPNSFSFATAAASAGGHGGNAGSSAAAFAPNFIQKPPQSYPWLPGPPPPAIVGSNFPGWGSHSHSQPPPRPPNPPPQGARPPPPPNTGPSQPPPGPLYPPRPPPNHPPTYPQPPPEFNYQFLLKPSAFGWETSYSVPCGNYQIQPRVVANLRLATQAVLPKPPKSSQSEPLELTKGAPAEFVDRSAHDPFHLRNLYNPPSSDRQFAIPRPTFRPRTCRWNFNAVGGCRLNFKCSWFQLPALFQCDENYLEVTDNTILLNTKFCGNRRPRRIYSSSSGKLTLTFKSEGAALPAILDCTVLCTDGFPSDDQKTPSTTPAVTEDDILSSSVPPSLLPLPTVNTFPVVVHVDSTSAATTGVVISSANKRNSTLIINLPSKPRLRMGNCKCGVEEGDYSSKVVGRIVGGSSMKPGESPWTAALVKKNSNRPYCGASLINNKFLLTAAHCVLNQTRKTRGNDDRNKTRVYFDVLLNEHDISQSNEIAGGTIRAQVDRVIVHPKYDNVTFDFDAALIRLAEPIQFNYQVPPSTAKRHNRYYFNGFDFHSFGRKKRYILPEIEARARAPKPVPVCLPTRNKRNSKTVEDDFALVTGWGLMTEGGTPSNEMLKARVQIFNDTTCQEMYKKHNYVITKSMMCAGYINGNIDSCVGDSGSPLVMEDKERFVLTGVVSWGRGCGRKQLPGVYTRVTELMDWIHLKANDGSIWCS